MALPQVLEKLQKIDNDERKAYTFKKLVETEQLDLITCDKILYAIGSILYATMDLNLLRQILNLVISEFSKKYNLPKRHFSVFMRDLLRGSMADIMCELVANRIFVLAFKLCPVDKLIFLRQYV